MIKENVLRVLEEIPAGVEVVAASKQRRPEDIMEVLRCGVNSVGENYVQEARRKQDIVGRQIEGRAVSWHLIGHLQKNKVSKAVSVFDVIQTLDSVELARLIDRECLEQKKILPVLIEVNSAREKQKTGVLPREAEGLVSRVLGLKNIKLAGIMTMGLLSDDQEKVRSCFRKTKEIFETIKSLHADDLPDFKYLSMGMSSSYRAAIEEGANMVRLGTILFGQRD